MLKEHTDKITNAELEKRSKQMGKMELGDNDDDDEFTVDTSEAGIFKKVKAEQEGLIKMMEDLDA